MKRSIYLYITPFFPSPNSWRGGYCLDAVKAIIHDGRYDVRVVTFGKGGDYNWDGIKVYRMSQLIAPCGLVPFLVDWINNRRLVKLLCRMGIEIQSIAVCHTNGLLSGHYATYLKLLKPNIKACIQIHSSYGFELKSGRLGIVPLHGMLMYFYNRHVVEHADVLMFVSEISKNTFGKYFVKNPEGEVRDIRSRLWFGCLMREMRMPKQIVVYNGIDKKLFNNCNRPKHSYFVIGCVANFQPLKSHITLLKAVNILKSRIVGLRLRLVGSGATLGMCKDFVSQNGLRGVVTFEEEMDHCKLPDFYRSLNLFVLPSRMEGFACVCVESSACGTPAMASTGISFGEVLAEEDRKKWLFRPCDEIDMVEKIGRYYEQRWKQHLSRNLDIDLIWCEALDALNDCSRA